jgi:hypothetical protein
VYIVRISRTSAGFIHKTVIAGVPDYLSSRFWLGKSPKYRLRFKM